MRIFIITILYIIIFNNYIFSAEWYVDNAASGSNAGTSWANAWESWANINWTSVGSGDTIYVSGGTTSKTYAQDPMDIGQSNVVVKIGQTSGNNGTAIFDGQNTEDNGISFSNLSNVTISGQVGSGSDCNIRFTQWDDDGVDIRTITNVELAYLEIDNNGDADEDDGVYINNIDGGGNSLHHCKIHYNYDYAMRVTGGTQDNSVAYKEAIEIYNNEIYDIGGDGLIVGQGADGISFYNNLVHTQPSSGLSNAYVDGIQCLAMQYIEIYNNMFYDLNNNRPNTANAGIFVECFQAHDVNNIRIYNNVLYDNNYVSNNHRGIQFKMQAATSITNILIANNTVVDFNINGLRIGLSNLGTGDISNVIIVNNLIYNCGRVGGSGDRIQWSLEGTGNWTCGDWGESVDVVFDYNINGIYGSGDPVFEFKSTRYSYANFVIQSSANTNGWGGITPMFVNWAQHASVDLSLDANDTAAIDKGVDLSSYFTVDREGNIRSGTWDIGAYEFGSTNNGPARPQNLDIRNIP